MRIPASVLSLIAAGLVACVPTATPPAPAVVSPAGVTATPDFFAERRDKMVTLQIEDRGVLEPEIRSVMRAVPRHLFVPPNLLDLAYEDHPLPIGSGQTISQPYIVALMTQHARIKRGDKVLEIGTGSGYQAAVLAALGAEVYSMEIIPDLAQAADRRLIALGYRVSVLQADGYNGWPEHAPYDAILVTAAPDHVPQPLVKQLKNGGRLVVPVGPQGAYQTLWQFTREGDDLKAANLGDVMFVPLVRTQ